MKVENAVNILDFIVMGLHNSIRFLTENGHNSSHTERKLRLMQFVRDQLGALLGDSKKEA